VFFCHPFTATEIPRHVQMFSLRRVQTISTFLAGTGIIAPSW
jgi:hypothetical protein